MTVFWKPTGSRNINPRERTKRLGQGLYVLWARCDVCHASGPSYTTMLLSRGEEHGNVCDACWEHDELRNQLRADGWSII